MKKQEEDLIFSIMLVKSILRGVHGIFICFMDNYTIRILKPCIPFKIGIKINK